MTINSQFTSISYTRPISDGDGAISLEEFYKKIKYFSSYEKALEQTANQLFKNIPNTLELTDLVNFIFNNCFSYGIPHLLDAIIIAHPAFTLSPYDKIRRDIVEDKQHFLTNKLLMDMLKGHNSLEKIADCYDLAYRLNHPYIYPESQTSIPTSDYNLNFLWVNLNPQDRIHDLAQNIFKEGLDSAENASCIKDPRLLRTFEEKEKSLEKEELENWEKFKEIFTRQISEWAEVNPGAQINLWFDDALVVREAELKTLKMIKDISKSQGVHLKLRNICQLSNISSEMGTVIPAKNTHNKRVNGGLMENSLRNQPLQGINNLQFTELLGTAKIEDSLHADSGQQVHYKVDLFKENENSLKKELPENWKEIKQSFTYRISKWADVNPGAQINLWYDSALVTQKAQQETSKMMEDISKSRGVDLKLRDIRQLSNISGEIENSLHPGTQVYYRVDILKVLITDHMMISSEESAKYCIVSDIDVEPMPPQQIFDQRTVYYLSTNGYVFNRVGFANFENSFFIFNKEKEVVQKVHYEYIIKQISHNITELRQYPLNTIFKGEYILGAQSVYKIYADFRAEMAAVMLAEKRGEERRYKEGPRKVVKCPRSQFNFGGNFSRSDYQAETFRFIGSSNIPYTINGRSSDKWGREEQIKELIGWKAEPLPPITSGE